MSFYTFILEYDGGTFVYQVFAEDEVEATQKWFTYARSSKDLPFKSRDLNALIAEFEDDGLVLLDQCINIWCFSGHFDNKYILVNIIKTDQIQSA